MTTHTHSDDAHAHDGGPTDIEQEGIDTKFIFGIMAGTIVVVIGLVFVGFTTAVTESKHVRDSFASEVAYPELQDVKAQAAGRLGHYGVVDSVAGVYQIPIDEAIKAMANEGYAGQEDATFSKEVSVSPATP
jgi:hypothetical protein